MNISPRRDPTHVRALCRAYAGALLLYPRSHRRRWGASMQETFAMQCRHLARELNGLGGWLLAVVLPDLFASVAREWVAGFIHPLTGVVMNKTLRISLGIVLEVVGTAFMVLSVVGLGYALAGGRVSQPGAFDSLTALQTAFGVGGVALLALGIRELVSACHPPRRSGAPSH